MAQVWYHGEGKVWNAAYENQYSKWVETRVGTDFVARDGVFFAHMQVDCADFQYLLRLVFSRDNGLEFAVHDPQNPGQLISSRSTRWNSIQNSELRARQFFTYVRGFTSTQTLPNDTVLVAMDKESIRPGKAFDLLAFRRYCTGIYRRENLFTWRTTFPIR